MSGKVIPVRVAVRIRPLSDKETDEGCQSVVKVVQGRPQIWMSSLEKAFTYDFAYEHDSTQSEVYSTSVKTMISNLFDGYNATVLAYGQTGSGKTHSIGTAYRKDETLDEMAGIIPRAVTDIFDEIHKRREEFTVNLKVAFVELYKEQLYDLLSPKGAKKEECICDVREDPAKGIVIPGLTEVEVDSLQSTMETLERGSRKRVTAATAMNLTSSRSHAIFTLGLEIAKNDNLNSVTESKFHLVDLAGSERQKKTKASGERQKEGISINQGLFSLGNVIAALCKDSASNGNGSTSHVPYRDSKLTRLLQDSLGGNSYTLMVACVSPADSNVEETLSTLRYADRARQIKNKPVVNMNACDSAELQRLRLENHELRLKLHAKGGDSGGKRAFLNNSSADSEELEQAREEIKRMNEETKQITSLLLGMEQECAHLLEQKEMRDSADEKIKEELLNLQREFDVILEKSDPTDQLMRNFAAKIGSVVTKHKDYANTIVDHELSKVEMHQEEDSSSSSLHEESRADATQILKSTDLHKQLQDLNKALAQKEKLASTMNANDEKLKEMKKSYEKELVSLGAEIDQLTKEKEELMQKQKEKHDPTSKVSEQRRKRIQDLEHRLQELQKKVLEQQRAIKLNEKNEVQVKKLADEIRQMKQARVKLIKTFKEDAEKLRQYKLNKEKEVQKLKQVERKQQAKIVKMETLHSKQQNVMKRQLEEAMLRVRRLKDIQDKQKEAKNVGLHSQKSGIAHSGDRVRNWINAQVDTVVCVKEAKKSRDHLMENRKTIMQQIKQEEKGKRDTLTKVEIELKDKKLKDLTADLQLLNAEIARSQKQITDSVEVDNKARFDHMKNLFEAKIALEHIFEKQVELQMNHDGLQSSYKELHHLYDEAMTNTRTLETDIAQSKHEHQIDLMQKDRACEEKISLLLNQMSSSSGEQKADIHRDEIQTHNTQLQAALVKIQSENEQMRRQMIDDKKSDLPRKEPAAKKKRHSAERMTEEEFYEKEEDSDVEEESDNDDDPDWHKTPLLKRIRKMRKDSIMPQPFGVKRKLNNEVGDALFPASKRSSNGQGGCGCSTGCKSKKCSCRKGGQRCGENCRCKECENIAINGNDSNISALSDVTNQSQSDNTASLLQVTFTVPESRPSSYSPQKSLNMNSPRSTEKRHYFKSPIEKEN